MRRIVLGLLAALLYACIQIPLQPVRPLPDFVKLAIEPGDRVELVTTDGDRLRFKVTHVGERSISSSERVVLLDEIDELYIRSMKLVQDYPCGRDKKLGCSVPAKVKVADAVVGETIAANTGVLGAVVGVIAGNWHATFELTFHDACVQHDFCYRHGFKTYGHSKEACDKEFYDNMLKTCGDGDTCAAAASEFHWAVKEHPAEGAYRTATSTHCEYDGPVETVANPDSSVE